MAARRLLADKSATSEERIEQMYETAFARPPKKEELDDALAFLVLQARQRELDPIQSEQDEDVWTDLCHILFNVKEFVFL